MRPRWSDAVDALALALAVEQAGHAAMDARFAFRDFGRWQSKARAHGAYGDRVRVVARLDDRTVEGVLLCPAQPTRRRSAPLSRYARLDP